MCIVKLWRKTNRTIWWLIPSAVSLRRAGVEQLYQVKRMIGGIGNMFVSVQCSECQSDEISNKAWVNVHHSKALCSSFSLPSSSLFSPLSSSFLSFSVSSLSVSLSLCLSPCDVALVLCLVCVRLCLCVLGEEGGGTVCTFKTPSVSRFRTSPCVPAPRAHVFQHVRVVQCGRFERPHGGRV